MAEQVRIRVELVEPGRVPELEFLELLPGQEFQIVWSAAAAPLRRLMLRGASRQLRVEEERVLLALRSPERPGDGFRVLQVEREIAGEPRIEAPGGLVVPVEQDARLAGRGEVLLDPPGEPPLRMELRILDSRAPALGQMSGGSSGAEGAGSGSGPGPMNWQVPGVFDSIVKPAMNQLNALTESVIQKLRAGPAMLRTMLTMGLMFGAVVFAFLKMQEADDAKLQAVEAQEQAEQAGDAATSSAEDAGLCRAELANLQRMMLDPEQARRTLIAKTLDRTLAKAAVLAAVAEGPERDAALKRDELDRSDLVAAVAARMGQITVDGESRAWILDRLERATSLRGELPEHVILWHPRPARRFEASMTAWSSAGSSLRGPWGIGERPLRVLAGFRADLQVDDMDAVAMQDPRLQTEWSIEMLRDGVLAVRDVLLSKEINGRLASAPEQIHLWSLALWYAYNELPEGDAGDLPTCIGMLLEGAAEEQNAEPGRAVLPPIWEVNADVGWTLRLKRSAACPWRGDDLVAGAVISLGTAAETALVRIDEGTL